MNAHEDPLGVWLFNLVVDASRYFLVAGVAFLVFWVIGRETLRRRLIFGPLPEAWKLRHDVAWSLSTIVIFATCGLGVRWAGEIGILQRYARVADHGAAWFAASIVVLIALQDAYFYWTHRAMHHRRAFRWFHRVHHVSTTASPWTAYAFSPLEALVHAAFVPLAWLVLPLHEIAVFSFLLFMIARNVVGHLSMELLPRGASRHPLLAWLTTTTHHALHHRDARTNFGLYFTFWDRIMGTTHAKYDETFERAATR